MAAVSFQVDADGGATAPARESSEESGQEEIVDAGAVCVVSIFQEAASEVVAQPEANGLCAAEGVASVVVIEWNVAGHGGDGGPVIEFILRKSEPGEALCPELKRSSGRRQ